MNTPVLYIVFNRPNHTAESFKQIAKIRPKQLYIAADGPRPNKPEDLENTQKVRDLVLKIDWPCEVKTLFREENLGCARAVSEAITWLFDHVESGIILEDDCVASASFFPFCQELLERYENDTRVMHVAGTNHHPKYIRDSDYSYYFSYYGPMWGWATWKRAWSKYDISLPHFDELINKDLISDAFGSKLAAQYFTKKISDARAAKVDTWDYQWDFIRMMNSGMTIVPYRNLVENIGFGEGATHTISAKDLRRENTAKKIKFPLNHPPYVIRDLKSDNNHFRGLMKQILVRKLMGYLRVKGYEPRG